jgi:photosystem II stability/assembly factor-like uncharacterized protein
LAAAVVVSSGALLPVVAASSATKTSTYLLYAGHGVGVIATNNPSTGCSQVFLTTDFEHWSNITPPTSDRMSMPKGTCIYVWTDAYFVSPTDGWLLARNGGSTDTLLRHTLNGGRTWVTQPGGDTGSNGGWNTISFVNATVGWRQQFGMGSNGDYALQRTLDAGATWTTQSADPRGACAFNNDVFSSSTVGFASQPWASANNPTSLWRTEDGGVIWSPLRLPPPPSMKRSALGLYGAPVFSGADGTVPVDYPVARHQEIYFYATRDGGLTWRLVADAGQSISVEGAIAIDAHNAAEGCGPGPSGDVVSGHAVTIAAAGPSAWWILRSGPKGHSTRLVVAASGSDVTSYNIRDLPSTATHPELAVTNTSDALLTVTIPNGYQSTYETTNGGVNWAEVNLSTARPPAGSEPPTCATSQLIFAPGRSGAAMGHIGMNFTVRNVGSRTCELDGYPTVQMMSASNHPVQTLVTFGQDYTVPYVAPTVTTLKPGASAAFLLGYSDATGYGNDQCPSARTLLITPPGDVAGQYLYLKQYEIQPYGGGTIQTLVCGEIAVSPIMTLAAAKRLS